MTVKPANSLVITRAPIVSDKGTATRDLIKWIQQQDKKVNASLTLLGIDPNAVIGGRSGTVSTALQNISPTGMLTPGGVGFTLGNVPGQVTSGQVGFTLDAVQDGTTRFAVAQVDATKLAIINFASAHKNKILDNVNDGATYQRFTRVGSGSVSLPTSLIATGTSVTASATVTGVLATDSVEWAFSGAPDSAYAKLIVVPYVTLGMVTFQVSNPSATLTVTPGASTVNFVVIR